MQSIVRQGGVSLTCIAANYAFFIQSGKKRHHQTICIVSHGQVIQGLLAILKSGAVDDFHRFGQPNASYSVFHLNNGICDTLRWGIATHLRLLE
ncbi:histidine phosphatase family protein [Pantoea sp. WMus005]|uniref:histidine phosphatase family protein n=1 Tax=Pantoea sp. WMus005 TaxID=2750734 RepID=UPI003519E191